MPTPLPSIPERLHEQVLIKAAENTSFRAISAWLLAEHRVSASHTSVRRLVERMRKERTGVAQYVAQSTLATHVVSDLDALSRTLTSLLVLFDGAVAKKDGREAAYIARTIAQIASTKLHFAGADAVGPLQGEDPAVIADRVRAKLAEARGAGG